MSNPRSDKSHPLPLLNTLRRKVLPWAEQNSPAPIVLASKNWKASVTPNPNSLRGTGYSQVALRGRAKSVKGPRPINNRSHSIAVWPEDGLQAIRIPLILCVVSGEADLQFGDFILHCGAGQFLFILPGTPFPDGSRPHLDAARRISSACELLWIAPQSMVGLGCWICHSEGESHFELPGESCIVLDTHAISLFQSLIHETKAVASGGNEDSREICHLLLRTVIKTLIREIAADNIFQFSYQKMEANNPSDDTDPIQQAQDYMRSHLHQRLTIDEVARLVFMSRSEFTRRFHFETGQTFTEFLTSARLQEAQLLFKTTDWSISMICERVGFKSSRLRVLFRQRLGTSPSVYRSQTQK